MRAECDCNAERQSESVNKNKAGREVEDCVRCVPDCLKGTLRSGGGGGGDSILYSLRSQCITRRR